MKKSQTIRHLLGFTQTEMALILNLPRRHYSAYEAGKGKIPLAATCLIAEMLGHIQAPQTTMQPSAFVQNQMMELHRELERSLKENEYQQLLTARRVAAIELRYTTKMQVLELIAFLSLRDEATEMASAAALRTISRNAFISLKGQGLATLSKLKLRLELLQLEKMLLDAEMRKMRSYIDFIGNKE